MQWNEFLDIEITYMRLSLYTDAKWIDVIRGLCGYVRELKTQLEVCMQKVPNLLCRECGEEVSCDQGVCDLCVEKAFPGKNWDPRTSPLPPWWLEDYLRRQIEWSEKAFGPGDRTEGVMRHMESEIEEVRAAAFGSPERLVELADLWILALDAVWRNGYTAQQFFRALEDKQAKNIKRDWGPWQPLDTPAFHVRAADEPPKEAPNTASSGTGAYFSSAGPPLGEGSLKWVTIPDGDSLLHEVYRLPEVGDRWKHWKGKEVEIVSLSRNPDVSSHLLASILVTYREGETLWTRDLNNFLGRACTRFGGTTRRFMRSEQ